ncbi:GntR family transcriptional regulator [Arthrobacter sp. NPDC058192]|uniref:GntR family transcriptional regulator n=1 Tax=Arthrobacter sp. NPDC058192 TaxID=3346372 RepID=UPI0036EB5AE9
MSGRRPNLAEQVRDELTELISNGTYVVGDRLPNEDEMSIKFAVSRATVREGYRALIDAGYLSRLHGKGTFVTRVPQRHALDLNVSYTAMIQAAGFTPSIRIISQRVQPADDGDRARLKLDHGAEVVVVERVRFADDRPVVYSVDRVPLAIVPEEIRGNLGASLFDMLENLNYGVRNGRAKLLPVLAGPPEAAQLRVSDGVPLLYFDEVDYDINGTPVLASYEWHTSDVFEMWLNRRAQPPAHSVETAPALAETRS